MALFLAWDSLCIETVYLVESSFCSMQIFVVWMSRSREEALSRTKVLSWLFWLFLCSGFWFTYMNLPIPWVSLLGIR